MSNKLHTISITRKFQICVGHRIYGHENKCKHLHGHNLEFCVTCTAPELDSIGRIIDFSVIKARVGAWLDEYWDHGTILWEKDPIVKLWENELQDHKVFILPSSPTIENLCSFLLKKAQALLLVNDIKVIRVEGKETENCSASVEI